MSKALILLATFAASVLIALGLIWALPGHYHLDENKIQRSETMDWSKSWDHPDQSLASLIFERLNYTLMLQGFAFFFVLTLSFSLSMAALRWAGFSLLLQKILAVGISTPSLFWIPLIVYIFSIRLDWVPLRYENTVTGWILPVLALTFRSLCLSTEILLIELRKVENQNYFLVARSKGLSRIQVFYGHGLKNSLIPYSAQMGSFLVQTLMGSVLVESLFSVPGIGQLFVESLERRDLPVVLVLTILYTFIMMLVHAGVEIFQNRLEPRRNRVPI